jgi:Arc/MetJ-type ribon-helix-helix transcriptional regulator
MQRLPNTPEGETKPIGFRLPPPMLAMIDREVGALRAASPEGASVTRSTALRALLVELEQRRVLTRPRRRATGEGGGIAAAAEVRRILAEMDTAGAEAARCSMARGRRTSGGTSGSAARSTRTARRRASRAARRRIG